MVNVLSGKDWIPKWEAKVVMATVTKAKTLKSNIKAPILCIAGGKHCDAEMVRQPALARAIKTEMASQEFRVRGEFIEISGFSERHQDTKSKIQSQQRRTESPKTGREEKTRKMAREAKIITRPSLPAPVPSKPNLSHLHITSAAFPYRCPAQCSEVKPVTEWAGMTDWVVAVITRSPGKVEEDKRWEVAKARVGRKDRLGSGLGERGRKAEARKREEVAKDRVGRNDPLSPSGREEVGEW